MPPKLSLTWERVILSASNWMACSCSLTDAMSCDWEVFSSGLNVHFMSVSLSVKLLKSQVRFQCALELVLTASDSLSKFKHSKMLHFSRIFVVSNDVWNFKLIFIVQLQQSLWYNYYVQMSKCVFILPCTSKILVYTFLFCLKNSK